MKKKHNPEQSFKGSNKKKNYHSNITSSSSFSDVPDMEELKKFFLEKVNCSEDDIRQNDISSALFGSTNERDPNRLGFTSGVAVSSQSGVQSEQEQVPNPFEVGTASQEQKAANQTTTQQNNQQATKQTNKCPCPFDNPPNTPQQDYKYCNFTNSEFFYFMSTLTPIELIIVYSVLAVTFTLTLNLREKTLLGAFLVDLGFTVNATVQQEAFQGALTKDAQAVKDREAYLTRQNNMAADIEALKKQFKNLSGVGVAQTNETNAVETEPEEESIITSDEAAVAGEEAATSDIASALTTSGLF